MATSTGPRRIGLFGGTFNPPHLGHVILARECQWQLRLDEVRLVVAARPPHREAPAVDPETRLAMVAHAVERHAHLSASRVEIDLPGPSYTVDTLTHLTAVEPDAAFTWIIGADQLLAFDRWRHPDRIVAMARLAVVARGDSDLDALSEVADTVAPGRVDLVEMPEIGISSTIIRERRRAGQPVDHLVPAGVAGMIADRGLYT